MTGIKILPPKIASLPNQPMPGDEEARSHVASEIDRDPHFRWLVEFHLGRDESRERYPEAYLTVS
jgi:hypothetical protein